MDEKKYLEGKGWTERVGEDPWRWEHRTCPGALYRYPDALDVQRSMDKHRSGAVGARSSPRKESEGTQTPAAR